MNSHNSLSAASDERKARLAKLKGLGLKRKLPADDEQPPSPPPPKEDAAAPDDVARLHLSGRNYDPETRGPKLGFEAPPTLGLEGATLEQQAAEAEAQVRQQAAAEAQDDKGIDLFKLQPKKPNWDLKRNLEKRMELLNVRTDNAIARLVRERILGAQQAARAPAAAALGTAEAGVDGVALVEGLRAREREEEEEERREREEEEDDDDEDAAEAMG